MRILVSLGTVCLAGWTGLLSDTGTRIVPCRDIILGARTGHDNGYRVALGVVSVPPSYLSQVVPTGEQPWSHWRKAGLAIRAARGPVGVTVPPAWRTRVAITWGNDTGIVSSLRIARCPRSVPDQPWNVYAGGFYLRSSRACVPLIFKVGQRSATVRFGIGRRC